MSESQVSLDFNTFEKPFIISGPCSAETEKQVMDTAKLLKASGDVDVFRSGIWKPRTDPNSCEGVGEVGLSWLQRVKKEVGLPVTVEVANTKHVELSLRYEIDVLWIGARSTVNPFVVQEIAESLKGVDIPVMVKNPVNPDLGLWLGAVRRLQKAGISEILAIHRGFSNLGEKYYRNRPEWQIAIEFKRHFPDIKLICDPSHICGRRDILFDVAQKAMDLDYDGLMIESHIDPDNAWSDAAQQITPTRLDDLLSKLVLREGFEDVQHIQDELIHLRDRIDKIDDRIINLLSDRMGIAREIGVFKKKNNVTILQAKRWEEIIKRSRQLAREGGLSQEFIIDYIKAVHDESINQQESVMKDE